MDWISFFAGASGMLFAGIILIFCIPARESRNNNKWRIEAQQDMKALHEFWKAANNLADRRNDILEHILIELQAKWC